MQSVYEIYIGKGAPYLKHGQRAKLPPYLQVLGQKTPLQSSKIITLVSNLNSVTPNKSNISSAIQQNPSHYNRVYETEVC